MQTAPSRAHAQRNREALRSTLRVQIATIISTANQPLPEPAQSPSSKGLDNNVRHFSDHYDLLEILGQGAHACVWKVKSKRSQKLYAAKVTRNGHHEILDCNINEYKNLMLLDDPHIMKTHELFIDEIQEISHHVMELVVGETLEERLQRKKRFSEREAAFLFKQLLKAIEHMHTRHVAHRDIKANNIMIKKRQAKKSPKDEGNSAAFSATENPKNSPATIHEFEDELVLLDFGVSKRFQAETESPPFNRIKMLTETGTLLVRAPEMINGEGYDELVDMWAAGVLLFEMLSGVNPFYAEYISDVMEKISKAEFSFENCRASSAAKDLIKRCLCADPALRLTAATALNHPWILSFDPQNKEDDTKRMIVTPNFEPRKKAFGVISLMSARKNSMECAHETFVSPSRLYLQTVRKNLKAFSEVEIPEKAHPSLSLDFGECVSATTASTAKDTSATHELEESKQHIHSMTPSERGNRTSYEYKEDHPHFGQNTHKRSSSELQNLFLIHVKTKKPDSLLEKASRITSELKRYGIKSKLNSNSGSFNRSSTLKI